MMERSCRIVKKNTLVYSKNMEERRKNIKDLEQKKQAELRSVNLMLADLGESLLSRLKTGEGDAGALFGEYQQLQQETADARTQIGAIQEEVLRLGQADEAAARNEQARSQVKQDLERLYYGLGEWVLEDGAYRDAAEPYGQQLDTLRAKVKSLEDRLEGLTGKDPANIVVQLGRSTQSLLLRSSLDKTRAALRLVYETAGEKMAAREDWGPGIGGELERFLVETRELRQQEETLRAEADRLKAERREIAGALAIQGGPVKRIRALEKRILRLNDALRGVAGKYGELAREKDRTGEWAFDQDDRLLLQKIAETRTHIEDIETRIEKIKASLAIDAEQAAIVRMEKAIADHRGRIATAEKAIGGLEERIRGAQQHLEELKKIEAYGTKNG
jgi:chromosome segregation ATPase